MYISGTPEIVRDNFKMSAKNNPDQDMNYSELNDN
jgi:hypothetical protein